MAKSISVGFTDTTVSGVSSLTFPRAVLNFETDFRTKKTSSDKSSSEVILANTTCPLGQPESFRIGISTIPNVYNGTGIEKSQYDTSTQGINLLVQLQEVIKVSDSEDPSYEVKLPVSYHMVVKVPLSPYITGDVVLSGIGRLLSGLFDTGSTSAARLNAMLRGCIAPSL